MKRWIMLQNIGNLISKTRRKKAIKPSFFCAFLLLDNFCGPRLVVARPKFHYTTTSAILSMVILHKNLASEIPNLVQYSNLIFKRKFVIIIIERKRKRKQINKKNKKISLDNFLKI